MKSEIMNLYTIDFIDATKGVITLSDKTHPIFKAHFPSRAILPGFMNFDIAEELFNIKITSIKKAKFLKIIEPNQTITYERNKNSFKVKHQDKVVASFTI